MEKESAKKKKHPVSEAQRRWAFAAEERGDLPEGKALTWSRRVEGKDLPEKTSSLKNGIDKTAVLNEIYEEAFSDELEKIAEGEGTNPVLEYLGRKGIMRSLGGIGGAAAGGAAGLGLGAGIGALREHLAYKKGIIERILTGAPKFKKNEYATLGALIGAAGLGALGAIGGGVAGDIKASQSFIKSRSGKKVKPLEALIQDYSNVKLRQLLHSLGGTAVGGGAGALIGAVSGGAPGALIGGGLGAAAGGIGGRISGTIKGIKKFEESLKR